jgi:hypothetical protein
MIEVNSTSFSSITINRKKYEHDVIVKQEKIQEARTQVRHLISKKEFEVLAEENPYCNFSLEDIERIRAIKNYQ